ncbi:ribbon-helix-helix protein, CopG family [Bifidobacterium sp. ESL0764]|uniref:ribbon-helix-helix protein, CopG family n=1 Tax=Bifidobacterium sp. ESL0764 TaxID=2983228 RepID=UPI0023F9F057|nr:ribbon-helix-helix protein, CopG family [Bifidobacterium sp. ESL0764]WEV66101.1 ribbon-helix-helix protein, CopG family [Bifidobacterium sp. ESL0764]
MTKIDIDQLTSWAESDGPVDSGKVVAVGSDAAAKGTEFLRQVGKPNLGQAHARGVGRSPKRQFRLSSELDEALTGYARSTQSSASEIIRRALADYLSRHTGTRLRAV